MKPIAKTVIVNVETVARFKVQSRHKYFIRTSPMQLKMQPLNRSKIV